MKSYDIPAFNQQLQERIMKIIDEYQLIKNDEKVVVALSGGKDSILTLYMLHELETNPKYRFTLEALTIDEGITNYREHGLKIARKHAKKMGIRLEERSLGDELGFTLDQVADKYSTACIPCGVFRRYLLNRTAYEMGADKIATGHNLDDEVQSFLMSFSRGDKRRFGKFGPKLARIHPRMVPRIKPLWMIPEKQVGLWAVLNNIPVHLAECPYSHTSLRSQIKSYLNEMEENYPGTKMNILLSFKKSFKDINKVIGPPEQVMECKWCNEPSSTEICKACEMMKEILG